MNDKIRQHLISHAVKNDWSTDDKTLVEILTDSPVIHESKISASRWWNNIFRVAEIDGMLIGYDYAQVNRDESLSDIGWGFDERTICEVKPVEKKVIVYEKVNPASGQSGINNILQDPNAKQAEQEAAGEAGNAEAAKAQESASQDEATGANESAEEGTIEG
jgi:hypothetical protein